MGILCTWARIKKAIIRCRHPPTHPPDSVGSLQKYHEWLFSPSGGREHLSLRCCAKHSLRPSCRGGAGETRGRPPDKAVSYYEKNITGTRAFASHPAVLYLLAVCIGDSVNQGDTSRGREGLIEGEENNRKEANAKCSRTL